MRGYLTHLGGRKDSTDADRYLQQKRGIWYYHRKVPKALRDVDGRAPLVRISLETRSIGEARPRRDAYEAADNQLWGAMLAGDDQVRARKIYEATVRRAEAMGFDYRPAAELAELPIGDLVERTRAIAAAGRTIEQQAALLGGETPPPLVLTAVYDLYVDEIATAELRTKSLQQRRKWTNVKKRSVERFVEVVGDIEMNRISREHALKFWRYWQQRIAPKEGRATHTPSSGNRELGSLRTIYAEYFAHIGQMDRVNPFAGLSFAEKAKQKKLRPPFPTDWIRTKILQPGALDRLNDQARAIVLATIEVGARPSETCNLTSEQIRINAPVPHLAFEERDDPDNPRELKSAASIRVVPLVGVALEVFKRFPNGFPRYREKEESLSQLVNKYLRNNGLAPTPRHTLYGLRHSMEDRMKEAGIGDDLRRILLGHRIDREEYGIGGSLEWRQKELAKVALPYGSGVLSGLPDAPAAP
ncbi:integrase [Devosia sp. D6-9]|nr:integrase [Devosia sp. D6-9]